MQIPFSKYQGTGNDFVIIDNRETTYLTREDTQIIEYLCDRRFGVGADGLILLQQKEGYDFEMVYFNSDGRESSMCGNGGRCITAFAKQIGIQKSSYHFLAIDGPHDALIREDGWVELKMGNVSNIEDGKDYYYLNTGSPHYVAFVEDLDDINVVREGQAIRYSDRFRKEGTNVNFVEATEDLIEVATYERGVEDETLSCGTGVTAAAIAYYLESPSQKRELVNIRSKGGDLQVRFAPAEEGFSSIWLCGPATLVYQGTIAIPAHA
jgi:diaminopimelate epimerase